MTSNKNLMKMLVSLCLISSLAVLHSTILNSMVQPVVPPGDSYNSEADTIRIKRHTMKNIVKSDENPTMVLVKWFKSIIDEKVVLRPDNLKSTIEKQGILYKNVQV